MLNFLSFLIFILSLNCVSIAMEKIPYHHLPDGTFRNPEGSPKRDSNFKWSFKIFNKEKKKLDMTVPKDHVEEKEIVFSNLEKLIVINHKDCGAAKIANQKKEFNTSDEMKIHLDSFFKIKKTIKKKFPKLKIELYLMSLDKRVKKFNKITI